MRYPWALGIVAISVGVAAQHPDSVKSFYQQLYPNDESKRQALDLCFLANPTFNRLDPEARDACYRQRLIRPKAGATVTTQMASAVGNVNFVDLWRASGQGHLSPDDIRFEQQNQGYTRSWRPH